MIPREGDGRPDPKARPTRGGRPFGRHATEAAPREGLGGAPSSCWFKGIPSLLIAWPPFWLGRDMIPKEGDGRPDPQARPTRGGRPLGRHATEGAPREGVGRARARARPVHGAFCHAPL